MFGDQESINAVRESTRKLLQKELLPRIEDLEEKTEFPLDIHRQMGELGLIAPLLPEKWGGAGDPYLQLAVAEEMAYINSGFGLSSLASSCLFGANVSKHGNEEQKQKYLPGIVSGEKTGCWALTEPQTGSNAVGIEATAQIQGDHFILNGSKTFITNAPIADYFFVIFKTLNEKGELIDPGFASGSAFILERGMEGLTTGSPLKKMGHKSSPTGEIFLDNVKVSAEALVGKVGGAFSAMKSSLDVERVIFSGLALGLMRFCIDQSLKYSKERKQFGHPIAEFQMIQDHIAQMISSYEACRVYLWHCVDEMAKGQDVNEKAAVVKLLVGETSSKVTNLAIQCFGGYGYMSEYLVERCLRDAKLFEIGAGTNEIQKLIIAKQGLKRGQALV